MEEEWRRQDARSDIGAWMDEMTDKLAARFGGRLRFVGLQGSRARGEASEESDIDVVVVIDRITFNDLTEYREIARSMPHPEKACGFIRGGEELANWPKSDLLQFSRETIPWHGSLENILPPLEERDVRESVRTGAANLYHAAVHAYIHASGAERVTALRELYKAAFFALQAQRFLETGDYIPRRGELYAALTGDRREILGASMKRGSFTPAGSDALFARLIEWCRETLRTL